MKKAMTLFAIVLALCLAASAAFAASPKRLPMDLDAAVKDPLVIKYNRNFTDCAGDHVKDQAFKHASTSAFYEAVLAESLKYCRMHKRLMHLRLCELIMTPMPICVNSRAIHEFVDEDIGKVIPLFIEIYDRDRAARGLPPRPSIDK